MVVVIDFWKNRFHTSITGGTIQRGTLGKSIEDLLSEMTLEEKVSMLAGVDKWHTRSIQRLGIPSIKMTDGPYGTRTMSDDDPGQTLRGTCFPTGSALGATWNTELVNRVGAALGAETKAKGCAILLGPCVNIHRSPLGGRNFESFTEDPYLAARLAVAFVNGVQSQQAGTSLKHFALNNSEFERFTISSEAAERVIREIYLPAFAAVVRESQPWTVMCAYNRINGTYASENSRFLSDILKNEWGFEGFVVSDWGAVHSTAPAANSGMDLEMPGPPRFFGDALVTAVKNSDVSLDVINDKVRRILSVIARSGAFDKPLTISKESSDTPENLRLAREAAQEAIVLLKNDNILPLKRENLSSIAVIGPNAAEARIQGGGSAMVKPYYTITPLEGISRKCGDSVKIHYKIGCRNNRMTPLLNSEYLIPGEGEGERGLTGEYFANNDLSGEPVLKRLDKEFTFSWGGDSGIAVPGMSVDTDNFSIRWTGKFAAPQSGKYKFGLRIDGLGRIYADNKLIVDKWTDESEVDFISIRKEYTGECYLEAGMLYDVRVEFASRLDLPSWIPRHFRLGCEIPLPDDAIAQAADIAANSDVALVFVGLNEEHETEGRDRPDMELPGAQLELIETVAEANKNTIVVLNNGAPVTMTEWIDRVAGVVEAWFPGQECGNAIADVLFGDVNPSGKLPDTFPKRLEDNPAYLNYPGKNGRVYYDEGIFVGYRYYDNEGIEPMFPFGYGLSYTTFDYNNLQVPAEMRAGEWLKVAIDVTNTGERAGKEVVQLYIRDVDSSLVRPVKELKGFQKVYLDVGETKTVYFDLGMDALSFYEPDGKQWVAEAGDFEVLIGGSSRDIRARACFRLND